MLARQALAYDVSLPIPTEGGKVLWRYNVEKAILAAEKLRVSGVQSLKEVNLVFVRRKQVVVLVHVAKQTCCVCNLSTSTSCLEHEVLRLERLFDFSQVLAGSYH